jgi:hypothetical protein
MRTSSWITCLWGLGLITLACVDDRPVYVDTGAAGTTGTAGTTGAAGTTGTGTGAAGTGFVTGVAGTGGPTWQSGCFEVGQIFESKNCALTGACHDFNGAAANFSLLGLPFNDLDGWRQRLVGQYSKPGGVLGSMCGGSQMPYLVAGSYPAKGLLLNKLRANPSCGDRMPLLGDFLTTTELDCVQRWANKLTGNLTPACPISCPGDSYCRNIAGSEGDAGTFACYPLPASCNGTLSCGCITGCFRCELDAGYIRCLAAP